MSKQIVTKEFIIEYMQNYYIEHNKTPKSTDKIHPFSEGTVRKYFGKWTTALIEANIPLRVNPSQLLNCDQCNKEFKKLYNQIKKSTNHFCSRSCAASYTNARREISEETKQKISKTAKQYNIDNPRSVTMKICHGCNKEFYIRKRKTCSEECRKIAHSNGASKGGTASAAKNVRRSKGEIRFAELCIEYFGKNNVLCNELIFKDNNNNFWDADIFITTIGLGILYNGIWHYEQVREKHNLKQVQSRDNIKQKIIINNGFSYYIVKDMGRYNEQFVIDEFNKFIDLLVNKKEDIISENFFLYDITI